VKKTEKYKIENKKLTKYLEDINTNVVRLNRQIEDLIDSQGNKTREPRKLQLGRFRQLFAKSNQGIFPQDVPEINPTKF
jgi:hypothetical protein